MNTQYCCNSMKSCVEDIRIPFDYNDDRNTYFIPFQYPSWGVTEEISYCPWCGVKLPEPKEENIE